MNNTTSPGQLFTSRVLYLLLIILGGLFLAAILSVLGILMIYHFDISILEKGLDTTRMDVRALWILQGLQTLFCFIFPPFVVCKLMHDSPNTFLSLSKPKVIQIIAGMFSILAIMPVLNVAIEWNSHLKLPESMHGLEVWMRQSENSAKLITDKLMSAPGVTGLLINLLIVAILAGLGEELFFRGFLMRTLNDFISRKKASKNATMHLSIWAIAILFSAIHLQFYGFLPRMLIGAWLGYLLWWTGSIWVPVAAHFTNNAISTLVMSSDSNGQLSRQMDHAGMDETWWLTVLSILITYFLIRFFIRHKPAKTEE